LFRTLNAHQEQLLVQHLATYLTKYKKVHLIGGRLQAVVARGTSLW